MINIRPQMDLAKGTAQTIRQPSTALFTLSSKDRFKDYEDRHTNYASQYRSPYNFLIAKNQSIFNGFFTRIGLTEIVFPYVIPNINEKTQKFRYTIEGGANPGTYTKTLNIGFAFPGGIASEMESLIQVEIPTYTMTYGSAGLPRFEWDTGDPNIEITFVPLPYNSTDFPYSSNVKQCFDLLGLSTLQSTAGVNYGGDTFCSFTEYIDIVCQQITYNQALKDGTSQPIARDAIARVYIQSEGNQTFLTADDANFCPAGCAPFTIYRQFSSPKQIQWSPNQPLGQVQIQVYDDQGEILQELNAGLSIDPVPGTDFNLTFLVSEN
jgi:hypothetical protein